MVELNRNDIEAVAEETSMIGSLMRIAPVQMTDGAWKQNMIDEFLNNIAVSTPLLKMARDVTSNQLGIKDSEDYEKVEGVDKEDILRRVKYIKGLDAFADKVAMLPFTELAVHEIMYDIDEDSGDLAISELIPVPQKYINYDVNRKDEETGANGFYISARYKGANNQVAINPDSQGDIPLTPNKFILSIYRPDVDHPMGKGLFRYGLKQAFDDLTLVECKLRALQLKYGDVIPVFGYDPVEAETEEGRQNLKARAESLKLVEGTKAIGIPLGGYNTTLQDGFQFISLADLKLELHIQLTEKYEDQIEKFIMGSKFSRGDTGSQAKDQVQQEEKETILKQLTASLEKETEKVLHTDSVIYGYNSRLVELFYYAPLTEHQQYDLDQREYASKGMRLDNAIKFAENSKAIFTSIAQMKELGLDDEKIVELTGVDPDVVASVDQAKVDEFFPEPEPTGVDENGNPVPTDENGNPLPTAQQLANDVVEEFAKRSIQKFKGIGK